MAGDSGRAVKVEGSKVGNGGEKRRRRNGEGMVMVGDINPVMARESEGMGKKAKECGMAKEW